MPTYTITLQLATDDAETPEDAAQYFAEAMKARGINVTVENLDTGESAEVEL